jgi:hypothetical protein
MEDWRQRARGRPTSEVDPHDLHEWLDLSHRFRLPEGRAGRETGRMER